MGRASRYDWDETVIVASPSDVTAPKKSKKIAHRYAALGDDRYDVLNAAPSDDARNDVPSAEDKEALAMIQEMESENQVLRASMEQAMTRASKMKARMIGFVASHESTVENYQGQLEEARSQLKKEKMSNQSLSKQLNGLKQKNERQLESAQSQLKREKMSKNLLWKELNGLKQENEKLKASMLLWRNLADEHTLAETAEDCAGNLTTGHLKMEDSTMATKRTAATEQVSENLEVIKQESNNFTRVISDGLSDVVSLIAFVAGEVQNDVIACGKMEDVRE